jgi:periplasmic divalent cation tolerance protein
MEKRQVLLAIVTAASMEEADRLSRALLERHACACVNVLPGVRSHFRWEGVLQVEEEVLMMVKTTADALELVKRTVRELHSYDVPEIIALPVTGGSEAYLEWVRAEVPPVRPEYPA